MVALNQNKGVNKGSLPPLEEDLFFTSISSWCLMPFLDLLRILSILPVPAPWSHHASFSSVCQIPLIVVQSLSRVQLLVTPHTAACQASVSITKSQSLLKLMSIELVIPSNHLILYLPLLLPSIFPRIRVFSKESALCIRCQVLELQLQHQSFQ